MIFTGLTITFLKEFSVGLWLTFPLLLTLAAAITVLGQVVGRKEGWSRFDSFYWSFVTATTVGYGDYVPVTPQGRVTGVFVMAIGILTLAVVTAQVSSSFVDQAARRRQEDSAAGPAGTDVTLAELDMRLARIEEILTGTTRSLGSGEDADDA